MCSCGKESETTLQYLLHCDFYAVYRLELFNDVCALNESLTIFSEKTFLKILIYGAEDFTFQINSEILKCTINSIIKSDRFSFPLFFSYFFLSDQLFSI